MQQGSVVGSVRIDDRMLLAILSASDAQLSRELGMSRTTIWRVRTGRAQLSRQASKRLSEFATGRGGARERAQAIAELYELALREADVREALAALSAALLRLNAT